MNAIKIRRARPDAALIGQTDSHKRPANMDRRGAKRALHGVLHAYQRG